MQTAVRDRIKPIFKDLLHLFLLQLSLGSPRNLNSLVCPKTSGCSKIIVQTGANLAVIYFDEERKGRISK